MELLQEILCHVLADKKVQVSFSVLTDTEVIKIVELECYKALQKIKAIYCFFQRVQAAIQQL